MLGACLFFVFCFAYATNVAESQPVLNLNETNANLTVCQQQFLSYTEVKNWDKCLETPSEYFGGDFRRENVPTPTEIDLMGNYQITEKNCFCDEDCALYGDCCTDVPPLPQNSKLLFEVDQWDCLNLPGANEIGIHYIYMISRCPAQWRIQEVRELCENETAKDYKEQIPVLGKSSNVTYKNVYCAICNQEKQLEKFTVKISCDNPEISEILSSGKYINSENYNPYTKQWTFNFGPNNISVDCSLEIPTFTTGNEYAKKYKSRACRPHIKKCLKEWSGSAIEANCKKFTSYRYRYGTIFKNRYCAMCNDIPEEELTCLHLRGSVTNYYDNDFGTYYPGVETIPSFSLLFDFNFIGGNAVGTLGSNCNAGEILDPLTKSCVLVHCGRLYKKVEGQCVRDSTLEYMNNSLTSDCRTKTIPSGEYLILSNESVWVNESGTVRVQGEFELNSTSMELLICIEELSERMFKFSNVQGLVSTICLYVSSISLVMHISVYILLPKLRNLPGKNLLSLSISLLVGQLCFLYGLDKNSNFIFCSVISIVMHFFFLAYFFWMNVMALDICLTFRSTNHRSFSRSSTFQRFSLYAWLTPALIVAFALLVDYTSFVPFEFRPAYAEGVCWITHRKSLLIFFALPIAIIVISNFILFTSTAIFLWKSSKITERAIKRPDKIRYILYVKLALVMGMTWVTAFVSAFTASQILVYAYITLNGLQGLFIFVAFTCKKKVYAMLRKRLGDCKDNRITRRKQRRQSVMSTTQMSSIGSGMSVRKSSSSFNGRTHKSSISVMIKDERSSSNPQSVITSGRISEKSQTAV